MSLLNVVTTGRRGGGVPGSTNVHCLQYVRVLLHYVLLQYEFARLSIALNEDFVDCTPFILIVKKDEIDRQYNINREL